MKYSIQKLIITLITAIFVVGGGIATAEANEKAEIYRLLIQADVMRDVSVNFRYQSDSKSTCAIERAAYEDSFTSLDKSEDHDCPLDFVCVTDLISYCAENYGVLECDDEGCTCRIC